MISGTLRHEGAVVAEDQEPLAQGTAEPTAHIVTFITARRDRMERRLADWVSLQSRTADPLGLQQASSAQRSASIGPMTLHSAGGIARPPPRRSAG